jgi:LAO/AO transport system kinase
VTSLAERVRAGDPRAIARAISLVEDGGAAAVAMAGALFPFTGRAYLVGVTGPPGAGKSTLVDRMARAYRHMGLRVGILAVDPSSPYSGGAILGDRVRMLDHATDPGVFIRSMATRGHLGGVSRATADAALVLDAAGFEIVLIETVGVGQDEIDIVRTADVSIVTLVPGTGDDVQALKAGVMEIADIFVVNKADREGADRAAAAIEGLLALKTFGEGEWRPPVLRTVASTGQGVDALIEAVGRFRGRGDAPRRARRSESTRALVLDLVARRVVARVTSGGLEAGELDALIAEVTGRTIDPYQAAERLLSRLGLTPAGWDQAGHRG